MLGKEVHLADGRVAAGNVVVRHAVERGHHGELTGGRRLPLLHGNHLLKVEQCLQQRHLLEAESQRVCFMVKCTMSNCIWRRQMSSRYLSKQKSPPHALKES